MTGLHHRGRSGPRGTAQGYLHLVPCYGTLRGYSLDQMRRHRETPNGLSEWMVARTTQELARRGVVRFSLNFAFLGALFREDTPLTFVQRLEVALARRLNPFFQIESLQWFNAKFSPMWSPRYIYSEPPLSFPRVALAYLESEAFLRLPLLEPAAGSEGWSRVDAVVRSAGDRAGTGPRGIRVLADDRDERERSSSWMPVSRHDAPRPPPRRCLLRGTSERAHARRAGSADRLDLRSRAAPAAVGSGPPGRGGRRSRRAAARLAMGARGRARLPCGCHPRRTRHVRRGTAPSRGGRTPPEHGRGARHRPFRTHGRSCRFARGS